MVRVEVAIRAPGAICVPGLMQSLQSELIDDSAFPLGQEDLWTGVVLGAMLVNNQALLEQLPKDTNGNPIVTPQTLKLGTFKG